MYKKLIKLVLCFVVFLGITTTVHAYENVQYMRAELGTILPTVRACPVDLIARDFGEVFAAHVKEAVALERAGMAASSFVQNYDMVTALEQAGVRESAFVQFDSLAFELERAGITTLPTFVQFDGLTFWCEGKFSKLIAFINAYLNDEPVYTVSFYVCLDTGNVSHCTPYSVQEDIFQITPHNSISGRYMHMTASLSNEIVWWDMRNATTSALHLSANVTLTQAMLISPDRVLDTASFSGSVSPRPHPGYSRTLSVHHRNWTHSTISFSENHGNQRTFTVMWRSGL